MASKLLKVSGHEAPNPLELSLRQAFEELQPNLRPPFPLSLPTPQLYSRLNLSILYGILTEPHFAKIHIKHLHAIVTDGYAMFVALTSNVVNDLYDKLVDSAREQLVWIVKEMVDVLGVGFDGLLFCLLRQIVGGDFSDGNLWLCFELVSVFLSKWDCFIEEEPMVLTSALYVFLRLLADHCRVSGDEKINSLRQLEITFCIKMLREQFHLCMKVGRDLVRLLQDLVHVPEFRALWKDLVLNPAEFKTPGFSDISQLYCTRTSSRYFLLRITPTMESQLRFLLMHVKFGGQKRYQLWFGKKFLCQPERETLIVDIVRFICCSHHPSNQTIQSDIIPRWAVIGWLLKCCRKNYVDANAKLALFYDWLFFDERVDNVMNIEPAILLMVCLIPQYIEMTHSLLDFLLRLADEYDLDRKDVILKGISSAFSVLVQKGVIHSLEVLTKCDVISSLLKQKLRKILSHGTMELPNEPVPSHFYPRTVAPLNLQNIPSPETPTPSTDEHSAKVKKVNLAPSVQNESHSVESFVQILADAVKKSNRMEQSFKRDKDTPTPLHNKNLPAR